MILFQENWDVTTQDWLSSSPEMTVQHSSFNGGSLQGSFTEQPFPFAEAGAFRADVTASGGAYVGDFWLDLSGFYGWQFDFYADTVLPSSLSARFFDGVNTYQANLMDQVSAVGSWTTITTPGFEFGLDHWIGPGGITGFSNALANVVWVEVRIERNDVDSQTFYLDEFQQVVPEPASVTLMLVGAFLCGSNVFRNKSRKSTSACV